MIKSLYSIEEISDTREILEARPPRLMSIFIFSVFLMLAVGFAWMWFGEIDESVKVTGIVRPIVPVSVVRNLVGGNVGSVVYKDESPVRRGDVLYRIDSKPIEKEIENSGIMLAKLKQKQENYRLFEKSIYREKNLFSPANAEYYNRVLVYEYDLERLELAYARAKSVYESQKVLSGSVADMELERLVSETRLAELNMNKYKSETIVTIKSDIEESENDALELAEQLGKLEENLAYCTVRAPIDGKAQTLYSFNPGDYLPPDVEIVRIVPEDETSLKVDLLIPNRNIGLLELGKIIQYSFLSLPKSEYGYLYGNVTKIPADIAQGENSKELIYLAEGSLTETTMIDAHDKKVQIKIGMSCEAKILLNKKRIFFSLLENLSFI